jgi:hypothetical protein
MSFMQRYSLAMRCPNPDLQYIGALLRASIRERTKQGALPW